jgi:lycopene beta-cyclase
MVPPQAPASEEHTDCLLVGGGLANCLVALVLRRMHPQLRVTLVEGSPQLCGNHTWSFHALDLPAMLWALLEPAVSRVFSAYEVRFPNLKRRVESSYGVVASAELRKLVEGAARRGSSLRLRLGAHVEEVTPSTVKLRSGEVLGGRWVLDARGPEQGPEFTGSQPLFQKFVGLECEVPTTGSFSLPVLMDATVEQVDGFRFLYVLPLAKDRILLEDTYFSDTSTLDAPRLRQRIFEYARAKGLELRSVLREESGVLPMPTRQGLLRQLGAPLRLGYGGGWFHPTTGYSFPVAARVAECFALPVEQWSSRLGRLRDEHRAQFRYGVFLNRLLSQAFSPSARWNVFERFFGFDERTIERFFALKMRPTDRLKILCGRPPSGLTLQPWYPGAQA